MGNKVRRQYHFRKGWTSDPRAYSQNHIHHFGRPVDPRASNILFLWLAIPVLPDRLSTTVVSKTLRAVYDKQKHVVNIFVASHMRGDEFPNSFRSPIFQKRAERNKMWSSSEVELCSHFGNIQFTFFWIQIEILWSTGNMFSIKFKIKNVTPLKSSNIQYYWKWSTEQKVTYIWRGGLDSLQGVGA